MAVRPGAAREERVRKREAERYRAEAFGDVLRDNACRLAAKNPKVAMRRKRLAGDSGGRGRREGTLAERPAQRAGSRARVSWASRRSTPVAGLEGDGGLALARAAEPEAAPVAAQMPPRAGPRCGPFPLFRRCARRRREGQEDRLRPDRAWTSANAGGGGGGAGAGVGGAGAGVGGGAGGAAGVSRARGAFLPPGWGGAPLPTWTLAYPRRRRYLWIRHHAAPLLGQNLRR